MGLHSPGGFDEEPMLLSEVSGSRCHNRALANYNFATLFERLPNVLFAYEVGRFFNGGLRSGAFTRRRGGSLPRS